MARQRKQAAEICVHRDQYPDGSPYYRVTLAGSPVGAFRPCEGGYVLFGRRKPLKTIEDATRDVLWRRMQRHLADAAILSRACIELPVKVDAVDPSAADPGTLTTREEKAL